MAKKRITLGDIAKELNVSIGLVSLVLSGKAKENRIGDEMAKKVVAKAREMGYQVNVMARGLRTGKSGIIGLAVADIANPYFGRMARHIENEAIKHGYQVMFSSSDEDSKKLNSILNVFTSRQVDGLIVVPVENSTACLSLEVRQSVPTVLIDRECDGITEDVVSTDNFSGGMELCNVLIKRGYKKIAAMVYNLDLSNNRDRINGYIKALKEAGNYNEQENLIYEIDFKNIWEDLQKALHSALEKGCDALFFANNNLGIQSLKILYSINKHLTEELGIVSFDNPEAFQIARPAITCYQQPVEKICAKTVEMLVEKIKGVNKKDSMKVLCKGSLIMRDSH